MIIISFRWAIKFEISIPMGYVINPLLKKSRTK
jgi:hypothetical protein